MTTAEREALRVAIDLRRRELDAERPREYVVKHTFSGRYFPRPTARVTRPDYPKPVGHGTETAYVYHRCRCDWCRWVASEARSRRRAGGRVTVAEAGA